MVTLEQVSRRVFSDPSWFVKTVVGAMLLPFGFAFGYLYRVALLGRRGEAVVLPDWEDWRGLFLDGLCFLAMVSALAVLPIFLGWVVALPFRWLLQGLPMYWAVAPFLYLPMVPGLVLAVPLTSAGLYRYQRSENFRHAFRVPVLLQMIVATKGRLVIPTLAYLGLTVAMFPLFPYALFTGGVVVFYYNALTFHQLEAAARSTASERVLVRR